MEIIKKENGNIEFREGGVLVFSMPQLPTEIRPIDKEERDHVKLFQSDGRVEYIYVDDVTETQIEPAAAVPFAGTVFDLADLLSSSFFFEVVGGTSNLVYPSGEYTAFLDNNVFIDTQSITAANVLDVALLEVKQDVEIESIRIRVTAAVVGNCVLGIYDMDSTNLVPSNLLAQSDPLNEFDLNLAAIQEVPLTSNVTLKKGFYWFGGVCSSTGAQVRSNRFGCPSIVVDSGFPGNFNLIAYGGAFTYNTILPSSFPAGTRKNGVWSVADEAPLMMFKIV